MTEYKLKGIISEIKVENDKYQIKLTGTTEYSIKYGEEIYNIFFNLASLKSKPKTITTALLSNNVAKVIGRNHFLESKKDDHTINFLTNCGINNKPIEVIIEEKTSTIGSKTKTVYTIKTITALSN